MRPDINSVEVMEVNRALIRHLMEASNGWCAGSLWPGTQAKKIRPNFFIKSYAESSVHP